MRSTFTQLLGMIMLLLPCISQAQTTIFNVTTYSALPAGWTGNNNIATTSITTGTYLLVETGATPDNIVTSAYDLSAYTFATFSIDVASFGSGTFNPAKIEVSYNGGATYTETFTSAVPTGASPYISSSTNLGSVSNNVVFRISPNTTAGRGVRMQNIKLTATGSVSCSTPPTAQASFGTVTKTDNTAAAALVAGTGGIGRVVKINTANSFTDLVNGANPAASLAYSGGEQVVYNGTGTATGTITGLAANTTYYLAVYEYNCATGRYYVNPAATTSFTTNPPPAIGLQVTSVNTRVLVDFDNTSAGSNTGSFAGTTIDPSAATGTLNSNAWNINDGSATVSATFGGTVTTGQGVLSPGFATGQGFFAMTVAPGNVALAVQPTGSSFKPGNFTLRVQNQTGQAITAASIGYTVYVENDQDRASTFNFYYSADNSTYTQASALNYTSTQTGTFGSEAFIAQYRTYTLTGLNIPAGAYLYLRWNSNDAGGSGSRDEFALDDVSVVLNPASNTALMPQGTYESAVFAGNVALGGNVTVTRNAGFVNGIVQSAAAALLTMDTGATVTGAGAASYVSGPVARNTNATSAVVLPVGKNGRYLPVTITPAAATATTYTAELFSSFKGTPGYTSVNAPLASVNASDYYNIERSAGGADAAITLMYDASTYVTDYTTLTLAHYNGTSWDALTGSVSAGSNASGTVTATGVSSFSPFAIGATTVQPLAVHLSDFSLAKAADKVHLSWTLRNTEGGEVVSVERSADAQSFSAIASMPVAKLPVVAQTYTDHQPAAGANYYRLSIREANGSITYSKTLTAVMNGPSDRLNLYPNPASRQIRAEWDTAAPATIELRNTLGQLLYQAEFSSEKQALIPVDRLISGTYLLTWKQGATVEHHRIQVTH